MPLAALVFELGLAAPVSAQNAPPAPPSYDVSEVPDAPASYRERPRLDYVEEGADPEAAAVEEALLIESGMLLANEDPGAAALAAWAAHGEVVTEPDQLFFRTRLLVFELFGGPQLAGLLVFRVLPERPILAPVPRTL